MPNSKSSLSLLLLALLAACASQKVMPPEESGPYMTSREFASGIAKPAFEMLTSLGSFYCKERTAPPSAEALAAFAGNQVWSQLRSSDLSETSEEIVWKATLASPSSLSEKGEVATSWRFLLKKPATDECALRLAIIPESRVCLKDPPAASDPDFWAADLLVDLALRAMTNAVKAPPSVSVSRTTPQALVFCLGPPMAIPVAIDRGGAADPPLKNDVKKRLEGLLRRQP